MKKNSKESKDLFDITRKKYVSLLNYHKELFQKECVVYPKFIPKPLSNINNRFGIVVCQEELYGKQDLYFEIVTETLDVIPGIRILWKYELEDNYENVLDKSSDECGKCYIIYLDKLKNITKLYYPNSSDYFITSSKVVNLEIIKGTEDEIILKESTEKTSNSISEIDTIEDEPIANMTIRDYYAIHNNLPVSNKQWLNQLIKTKH